MKDLAEFLPLLTPYAPGVANPTAFAYLRQSAMDFCERTRLWRYEDEFAVLANDTDGITTPSGSQLFELELVQFNGCDLCPAIPDWLDENFRGWRAGELTGQPNYFTQTEPNTIRLVPGEDGTVNIYAWLKPSQDATQLPDWMVDQYREVIAHGALARLLLIPGQPFSNPTLANGFITLFSSKVDSLAGKGRTGQQRARQRTKGSFF